MAESRCALLSSHEILNYVPHFQNPAEAAQGELGWIELDVTNDHKGVSAAFQHAVFRPYHMGPKNKAIPALGNSVPVVASGYKRFNRGFCATFHH